MGLLTHESDLKRIWHQLEKLKSLLAQVKEYLVSTGKNVVGGKKVKFESCTMVSNTSDYLNI